MKAPAIVASLALAAALAAPASAQQPADESVVAGLSQHSVSLTTGFSGSELFIYGAVKRTAAAPPDEAPLDVIVAVTGPSEPVEVRRKERRLGIWMNGRGVRITAAPSFYAVASTKAFLDTVSYTDDLAHRIGIDYAIRLIDAPAWVDDREAYRTAVVRIREAEGLYAFLPGAVRVIEDTLFETRIKLPANLVEGDYTARIFLIRDKSVRDVFTDRIEVRRAGLGRMIYQAAQTQPAFYGIASIVVALIAGWLASAFFRTFFPT